MVTLTQAQVASPDLITITDITQGRTDLRLIGQQSADLLSRLCGLDFDSYQFPDRNARQSSVAKTRQLILHHDMGDLLAYSLIGARSLGVYLWDTISMAGRELGIMQAGDEALVVIEQH